MVSVDGIGAYGLMSRNAMMRGLRHVVEGDRILPFVQAFYGKPSTYIWEDDVGDVHQIVQGVGQHPALAAVAKELREGEKLFAYQDDLYSSANQTGSE